MGWLDVARGCFLDGDVLGGRQCSSCSYIFLQKTIADGQRSNNIIRKRMKVGILKSDYYVMAEIEGTRKT